MSNDKHLDLSQKLQESTSLKLLIPSYQQAIHDLASNHSSKNLSLQKALQKILNLENQADLQSINFVEEQLENFVENNFPIQDQRLLQQEFRHKAQVLLAGFLFFNQEEKQQISKQFDLITLAGLRQIIELLRNGHHKQNDYLTTFAQKDPLTPIKFELITQGKSINNKK